MLLGRVLSALARDRGVLDLKGQGRTRWGAMMVPSGAVDANVSSMFGELGPPSTDDHRRVPACLRWA